MGPLRSAKMMRWRELPFGPAGVALYVVSLGAPVVYDYGLLLLVACTLLAVIAHPGGRLRVTPIFWTIAGFIAATALATALSIDVERSLGFGAALLPSLLIYYLIANYFEELRQFRYIYFAAVILTITISAQIFIQRYLLYGADPTLWIQATGIPIIVVPNDTLLLAITAPFAVYLVLENPRSPGAAVGILSLVAGLACITVLHSRGALLAYFGAILVTTGLLRPRVALGAVGVLAASFVVVDAFSGFALVAKFTQTTMPRVALWWAAWEMFLERPIFGYGPHAFALVYRAHLEGVALPVWAPLDPRIAPWPHNLYLEILSEYGLAGMIAFGTMVVIAAREVLASIKDGSRTARGHGVAFAAAMLSFCGAALVELTFLRLWVYLFWCLILGAISIITELDRSQRGAS